MHAKKTGTKGHIEVMVNMHFNIDSVFSSVDELEHRPSPPAIMVTNTDT
jgi:hypothetical protein